MVRTIQMENANKADPQCLLKRKRCRAICETLIVDVQHYGRDGCGHVSAPLVANSNRLCLEACHKIGQLVQVCTKKLVQKYKIKTGVFFNWLHTTDTPAEPVLFFWDASPQPVALPCVVHKYTFVCYHRTPYFTFFLNSLTMAKVLFPPCHSDPRNIFDMPRAA